MTAPEKLSYRPQIDGLRAVAVLSVLLFHAGLGFPGGFVGVDVFFVISGFLITSILWYDVNRGAFTFLNFWERRFRRLAPAAILVTLATLFLGGLVMTPRDYRELGTASLVQTAFASNYYYAKQADYFSSQGDVQPLLHTWSLSVEEQFYLLAPLIIWAVSAKFARRRRSVAIGLLLGGITLSFGLSLQATNRFPEFAFYSLPTRAWELMLGSLLVFIPTRNTLLRWRSAREALAATGLSLIVVPVFTYSAATPFPGSAALSPCLGAAILVWLSGSTPTMVGRLLSLKPVVFFGLISYSLYLWHWPLLALNQYRTVVEPTVSTQVVLVLLSIALAVLTWKYVETPFRTRSLGATRQSMFRYTFGGAGAVATIALVCLVTQGLPRRQSEMAVSLAQARYDHEYRQFDLTAEEVRAGQLIPLGDQSGDQKPAILIWGDSHARSAMPAVDAYLKERGIKGCGAVRSSVAPLMGYEWNATGVFAALWQEQQEKSDFNRAVMEHVKRDRIPCVMLAGCWTPYLERSDGEKERFLASLRRTVQELSDAGVQVWLMDTVPIHSYDIPRLASLAYRGLTQADPMNLTPAMDQRFPPAFVADLEALGCHLLDPKPYFRSECGNRFVGVKSGIVLYCDDDHLTASGARLLLTPMLQEALSLNIPPQNSLRGHKIPSGDL